ncbi:26S Proteasome Regulatory Subunit 6A [Manis pentadactyla]|nr:26S Proteasome Regulatory Subunit 6A [Manis pentadactyla]
MSNILIPCNVSSMSDSCPLHAILGASRGLAQSVLTFRREPILENNRTSLVEYSHNALEHDRRLRFISDKMKINKTVPYLDQELLPSAKLQELFICGMWLFQKLWNIGVPYIDAIEIK